MRSLEERFWSKVDLNGPDGYHYLTGENLGPCWLWTAAENTKGYGRFLVGGRLVLAHRLAYELEVGPIPDGLELDHLCRVHPCVRHTEPVTHGENMRRGGGGQNNAIKTHCPTGHEYAGENLRLYQGRRYCRACNRARKRASA